MLVVVGRVGRAHGLRGEVSVEVRTDAPDERFVPGAVLLTDPEKASPLTVRSTRSHHGRLLVRFNGISDRGAAETLRGTFLLVDIEPDEHPEDPDEFYDHQLVGLSVVTVSGMPLGEVDEVLHPPGQDVLAVRRPDGREVLVPFVSAIVPEVDLEGRRVVVDPPAGLPGLDEE